jgi:hypothetical protein
MQTAAHHAATLIPPAWTYAVPHVATRPKNAKTKSSPSPAAP